MVDDDVNNVSRLLHIAGLMDHRPSGCQKKLLSSYARELSAAQRTKLHDRTLSRRPASAHVFVQRTTHITPVGAAVTHCNIPPTNMNSQKYLANHRTRTISYSNDKIDETKTGDVASVGPLARSARTPVAQPLYRRPLSAAQLGAVQNQSEPGRAGGGTHTLIKKHSQKQKTSVMIHKTGDASTFRSKPPAVPKTKKVTSVGEKSSTTCRNKTVAGVQVESVGNKPRISPAKYAEVEKLPSGNPVLLHRRVQSAKGRLISDRDQSNTFSRESKQCRLRPQSAQVQSGTKRPQSAKHLKSPDKKELEPHVFGYVSGKTMSGSVNDICENEIVASDYQWKMAAKEEQLDKLRDHDVEEEDIPDIDAPSSLHPLLPWLTTDLAQPLGISSQDCLMFLPSLRGEAVEDLPVVPEAVVDTTEPLPHQGLIEPPQPWVVKKYDHPWTKIPLPEYPCKHNHKNHKYHVRIMDADGMVLHESHTGPRTADVVRQEIQELEALMKGVGCHSGISLVVQYQAEINHLQDMIQHTMGRVEEIERRERAKLEAMEPSDLCGLRKFYKRHDQVMEEIKKRYEKCIEELAAIETDPNIAENLQHFRERHQEFNPNTDLP